MDEGQAARLRRQGRRGRNPRPAISDQPEFQFGKRKDKEREKRERRAVAGRRKENVVFSVCLRSVGAQWSEGLSIEKRGVSAVAASKPVPHPGAVGAHITIQPRTNLSIHHRKQAYPTPRTQHRPPRRGALYMNPSLISAPTPCMSRPHYMGRLVSTDLNLWTGRYKHT